MRPLRSSVAIALACAGVCGVTAARAAEPVHSQSYVDPLGDVDEGALDLGAIGVSDYRDGTVRFAIGAAIPVLPVGARIVLDVNADASRATGNAEAAGADFRVHLTGDGTATPTMRLERYRNRGWTPVTRKSTKATLTPGVGVVITFNRRDLGIRRSFGFDVYTVAVDANGGAVWDYAPKRRSAYVYRMGTPPPKR